MLGFTAAEVMMHHWNSKKIPLGVYIFGRRVHHGEIGPYCLCLLYSWESFHSLDVIAGVGAGLIKGDLAISKNGLDLRKWTLCKKKYLSKFN